VKINKTKEFWKPLVYSKGKLSERLVLRELHDYEFILEQISKVYCHITKGRLSKPMYEARTVISMHDELYLDKGYTQDDIIMFMKDCKTIEELKEELKQYFDIEQ
jgi:hypothetical protein